MEKSTNKGVNKMTYEKLQDLCDEGKARIIDSIDEGTCQLWEVDGHADKYVADYFNDVITQAEDNGKGEDVLGPEEAYFPY